MTVLIGSSLDQMVRFACPSRQATSAGGATVTETAAGRFAMLSPHRPARSWSLDVGAAAPHEVAGLLQLVGYGGGGLVFVSEHASATNGLTPAQSALHSSVLPVGVTRGGMERVRGIHGEHPVAYTATMAADATVRVLGGVACPVVPGMPVTVSMAMLDEGAPMLGVRWSVRGGGFLDALAAAPAPVEALLNSTVITEQTWVVTRGGLVGSAAVSPAVRRWRTLTAPDDAIGATVIWSGASKVAAPALTLLDQVSEYGEGDGAPEVVVPGWSQSLIQTVPGRTLAGYSLTLEEVGLALR